MLETMLMYLQHHLLLYLKMYYVFKIVGVTFENRLPKLSLYGFSHIRVEVRNVVYGTYVLKIYKIQIKIEGRERLKLYKHFIIK